MSEWREFRLDELADIVDCEHKTADIVERSEFYSIRTSNISNGKIDFHGSNRISFQTYQDWTKRAIPKEGDIILAREAPVGEVGMVKKGYKVCLGQRTVLLSIKNDNVDNYYLLYYLVNPSIKFELISRSTGSVVAHLNMKDIRAFEISIPPIPEQKAIAAVLSSLDDKIDLLHRQNKTLEAMAETLFQQWFVVEAKEDWETRPLGELVTVKRGGSPRPIQEYLSETGLRWLKISDATKTASPFIFEIKEHIKEEGLNKTTFLKAGALVLSNSATPGIPKILQLDSCIHDGWLHFPKSYFSNEFLYLLFKKIRPELLNQGNGSIFTNLKTDILKEYPIPIADDESLKFFDAQVKPIFEKLLKNTNQIKTLESLRDTLLPKLMSGEVRVAL
jgi:type I restriction enzyme S subunit